jgi:hypothetical protein
MSAVATRTGVTLTWTTVMEIDTVGFRILRATSSRSKAMTVVADRIPASGDSLSGATYEFVDTLSGVNRTRSLSDLVCYIEDIDLFGKTTRHGPTFILRGTRQSPVE